MILTFDMQIILKKAMMQPRSLKHCLHKWMCIKYWEGIEVVGLYGLTLKLDDD